MVDIVNREGGGCRGSGEVGDGDLVGREIN